MFGVKNLLKIQFNLYFASWLCLLSYKKEGGQKYAGDIVGNGTLLDQDLFFLQRHQMLVHHEKELDHLKRMMERKEEELIKNQVRKTQEVMKIRFLNFCTSVSLIKLFKEMVLLYSKDLCFCSIGIPQRHS